MDEETKKRRMLARSVEHYRIKHSLGDGTIARIKAVKAMPHKFAFLGIFQYEDGSMSVGLKEAFEWVKGAFSDDGEIA